MGKVSIVDPHDLGRHGRKPARVLQSRRVRGACRWDIGTVYVLDTADADFKQQFQPVLQLKVTRARRGRTGQTGPVAAE